MVFILTVFAAIINMKTKATKHHDPLESLGKQNVGPMLAILAEKSRE